MIDAGDIYLRDLGGELPERSLVLSRRRFHDLAGRAIVAPAQRHVGELLPPWWVMVDGHTFALDQVLTLPIERLLDRVGRADSHELMLAQRALRAIT